MSAETQLPVNRQAPDGTLMTQWVIYDHPRDFPNGYVLRAHYVMGDEKVEVDSVAWTSAKVEVLRMIVPPGLHCMPRFENDDKVILEVWI